MNNRIVPMSTCGQVLYNYTRCGDFYVIGCTIIENEYNDIKLDKNLVRNACIYMIKRHPLLRSYLEINESSIGYKIRDSYDINIDDIEWKELNSRDELNLRLEELNKKRFNYETKCRLWRCSIYGFKENDAHKFAIGFLIPLFMTDALNISTLMIELVNIINSIINKVECVEMRIDLDVIEDMHTIIEKNAILTRERLKKVKEINSESKVNFKFDQIFRGQNEYGSKIDTFLIGKENTKKLIMKAKLKNIKLTGFFMSAIFYSLNDLYKEYGLELQKDLIYGISTNLRCRLEPKVDFSHIGYFSALVSLNACYPSFGLYKDVWEDASYLDKQISSRANLDSGAILHSVCDFDSSNYLNELFEKNKNDLNKVCSILNKESVWEILLSNAGTYVYNEKKQNPDKPFRIKEIYFADSLNSNPAVDACLIVHVNYWDEQLMFMISSNKSGIGSQYVDRYNEILRQNINEFAN